MPPVESPPETWGAPTKDLGMLREHTRKVAIAVRAMLRGGSNSGGTVTLTAGAATTVVTYPQTTPGHRVFLTPQTASAAAEVGTTYAVAGVGSFTINHANNGITDRTFGWEIKG